MNRVRTLWSESCAAVLTLVDDERVEARWDDPSCLPGMTIGALCGHVIASGILEVEGRVAEQTAPGTAGISPSYSGPRVATPLNPPNAGSLTAANLHALVPIDANNAINRAVEAAAVEHARGGMEDLVTRGRRMLAAVQVGVEQVAVDAVVDCWGVPLNFDEFLCTRIVEIAVHAEDLTDSMDFEASGISEEAMELVCSIGISAAIRRNGPTAVLRALFRSDRYPIEALRPL